jgi:hypothetical protein
VFNRRHARASRSELGDCVASRRGRGVVARAELGVPIASGSQNALRYASFPVQRCLVIAVHEHVWLYNTLDHQMSGVPQEQGRGSTVWWRSPPCR